jgi:tetratricopeptide (TPR) repeat protein
MPGFLLGNSATNRAVCNFVNTNTDGRYPTLLKHTGPSVRTRSQQQEGGYMTRRLILIALAAATLAASLVLVSCQQAQEVKGDPPPIFYDGFGNYTRAMTTDSPEAQRWFNQGMQLTYGFNHDEAVRSFEQAALADPDAAMPWWGIAYCQGININDPMMSEQRSQRGYEAVQEALTRLDQESPVEHAMIKALATRYAWPAPEDRLPLDQAYADAMSGVHQRFPGDPDVATLYAESLMNLQAWDYWDADGGPKGRIEEIVSTIESVLASSPNHPGANHFYIHAVEASNNPDRAVAAAERLTNIVPGSGHLVHMPSHIFVRVGRYAEAAQSNRDAIAADQAYFAKAPAPGFYSLYYAHNIHFLAFASMMSGDFSSAIAAAEQLEAEIPEENLRELAGLIEGIMATRLHVLIRFGKWEEILQQPDYPEWRLMSRATRSYARAIACSALGRTEQARKEMVEFERRVQEVPGDWYVFNNQVHDVLPVARAMMQGELLFREGRREEAFEILREGIEHESQLVYDEPPAWMLPVRHALGALLIADGKHAEAEKLYREDLETNRNNGWALTGLRNALLQQGRLDEAKETNARLAIAFSECDVVVTSSCFCEP